MEKQYLQLLRDIKEKGTKKSPAREGMPSTISLFGYQMRHNLADGFPLLTTKEINFKNIVIELLWFLQGDTNIKYLVNNGCNIWNEDAYNYYCKKVKSISGFPDELGVQIVDKLDLSKPIDYNYRLFTFKEFVNKIKNNNLESYGDYTLGDCGYQYGKVWRRWENKRKIYTNERKGLIDQIKNLIDGLRNNPESRRHIITSIDPAHENDLALYWCHVFAQFNCRPLTVQQRLDLGIKLNLIKLNGDDSSDDSVYSEESGEYLLEWNNFLTSKNVPKYYLDCSFYQRSADVFLGVPYNIASYALLTELLAKMCNMIPRDLIHSFGDVHIYDNHLEAINEQLSREPKDLPKINLNGIAEICNQNTDIDYMLKRINIIDIEILNYNPCPPIRAKLSTGLK